MFNSEKDREKLELERTRAEQARRILDDPLYISSWEALKSRIMSEWVDSPARDAEGREQLWQLLKLLERAQGYLTEIMETGKLAERQLAEIEKRGRRKR